MRFWLVTTLLGRRVQHVVLHSEWFKTSPRHTCSSLLSYKGTIFWNFHSLCPSLTQKAYLTSTQVKLTKFYFFCFESLRGKGPFNVGIFVVERTPSEVGAANFFLRPYFFIRTIPCVTVSVTISRSIIGMLFPLVHFDFSLQSIAVRNFDPEFFIFNFFCVHRSTSQVCKLKFVCVVQIFVVKGFDSFLSLCKQFLVSD